MHLELMLKAVQYVVTGPFFWASMGFTTAIAMFVGAAIYDGQLPQIKKGMLAIFSYAGMILWVTTSRVIDTTTTSDYYLTTTHPEYAYAGMITILFVTLAWALGIFLGVQVFALKYKGKKHI